MKKYFIIREEIKLKNCKFRVNNGFFMINDKRTKAYKQYTQYIKEIKQELKKNYKIESYWTEKVQENKATICFYVTQKREYITI